MRAILFALLTLPTVVLQAAAQSVDSHQQHAAVLDLNPVGYWPVDEGEGTILHDRSGHGNDGRIHHTPWKDGLLDFTNAYQFAEISRSPEYVPGHGDDALTMGGWIFSRRSSYDGNGFYLMGNRGSLHLQVVGDLGISVGSSGGELLIAAQHGASIVPQTWQHVIFTYLNGTGKLYLNGSLAQSAHNLPAPPLDTSPDTLSGASFLVGWDANNWDTIPLCSSLDGSVRDLTLFNRALSAAEVKDLFAATTPATQPQLLSENEVLLDGRMIPLSELAGLTTDQQGRAFALLSRRTPEELGRHAQLLMPALAPGLDNHLTRLDAIDLLNRFNTAEANQVLGRAKPGWRGALQDEQASEQDRATAAIALTVLQDTSTVALLSATLERLIQKQGAHLPRVEDLLRNAILQALLKLAPEDEPTRELLGRALARPVLEAIDLSRPAYANARTLAAQGNYMDALDSCRDAMHNDGVLFISQNDPFRDARQTVHPLSYTCAMSHDGYTYKCGSGVAYDACEEVPQAEFARAVAALSPQYPQAASWRAPDYPHLRRANITKTAADGTVDSVILEGDHFIFDGGDEKNRSWSIAADKNGYLHLMGGQHNVPYPNQYLPGAWEEMGLSRNREDPNFPRIMYWVSTKPGDIHSFEFAGWGNPRYDYENLDEEIRVSAFRRTRPYGYDPPPFFNYINFIADNDGELYVYGRILSEDKQAWGLYHYNAEDRRWNPIGGDPRKMFENASEHIPGWGDYLLPPGNMFPENTYQVLGFSWQPGYYDYIRASGVRFDLNNRMYVNISKRGIDRYGRYVFTPLFAYSDDNGETFHRADGSMVLLPLTNNPAPDYHADVNAGLNRRWLNQWKSLIERCGFVPHN